MHSLDPNKNWHEFWREVQAILSKTDGRLDFEGLVFTRDADFSNATFSGEAGFVLAKFRQALSLTSVRFDGIADFYGPRFDQPAHTLFHGVNERGSRLKVRLSNCLLETVRFEDVNWHRQGDRLVLQDELDLPNPSMWVTHELVADAYRRLVNNFEKARQYQLAEECILGEMEMRRRDPRHFLWVRWLRYSCRRHRWAQWLGENLSVVNLYRVLRNYGTSYRRAFGWLAALALLLFPFLFGLFGLRRTDAQVTASSTISWQAAWSSAARPHQLWQTYKAALEATLERATLLRNPYWIPGTGRGRAVAICVLLTMPGQLALLLFALRRRFRR